MQNEKKFTKLERLSLKVAQNSFQYLDFDEVI